MSAETLRQAAALIRERASVATVGPWEHTYGGIFVGAKTEDLGISYECQVVDEDDLNFAEDDAEYIASWHPLVAVAVADWLDAEAASMDSMAAFSGVAASVEHEVDIRGAALTLRKSPDGAVSLTADTSRPALAVARAYLGESA